jgi:hypothetical protein
VNCTRTNADLPSSAHGPFKVTVYRRFATSSYRTHSSRQSDPNYECLHAKRRSHVFKLGLGESLADTSDPVKGGHA